MVRRREGLSLSILSTPSLPESAESRTTPSTSNKCKPRLSKQLSTCETPRDVAWEKRRRQVIMIQDKKHKHVSENVSNLPDLTDEDLRELKGSIELGFGFNEDAGQKLCNTLPALDLYFAVNRQLSPIPSPSSSGRHSVLSPWSSSVPPSSPKPDSDTLKILCPGDDPQQVKTRLRHWAQAVACSVMQSY
ncbi:PREDICTED: uncharacterized protein LOC104799259 [Tarenaya hassleriana]|uniref:uncharacterized protein LOC104799259 n=1 Tax=Tarenaya hassleriana TaxID=28532 RepID=UPI00053C94E2|nr:PREDICTED: uncharacterized protein LOC104799259 [Tarenaya hassleriana]